ncbi:AAA family ATPase [Cryobacterium sp. W22_MBD10_FK3]|uniref:AAA family ATPase n=1 Tax=Cryobacterium sp. W22_MBD10_FK3 TaxID=3240273 RepID=UPI003F903D54
MATRTRNDYHFNGGLEQALIDLVQVGVTGHGSGVRQLATRLIRAVPPEIADAEHFRGALHTALTAGSTSGGLRFARGETPSDGEDHPLVDVEPTPDGGALVLAEATFRQLQEIVDERHRADELAQAGVSPTRSLLLSGPPGVGKTLAAKWLAEEIGVPLVSLDLASVVSSYLGSSGRNIKSVLSYAQSGPCVLLLDEFDAVAKRRDDDTDIGELKRIVNVLLVELDRWPDTSLLVAATNHPQLLDPAVGRRFDRRIELEAPTYVELRQMLQRLSIHSLDGDVLELASQALVGVSGSEVVRLWETARRRAVLQSSDPGKELLDSVVWRAREAGPIRDKLWLVASEQLNLSARQIASRASVTHPTVSAALKRAKEIADV